MAHVIRSLPPTSYAARRDAGVPSERRLCARWGEQRRLAQVRLQDFRQPLHQFRRFQNRAQQHQALTRILVLGYLQQRLAQLGIARKLLGSVDQPQVEPVFHGAQVAGQLGVVALGIVHQIPGMHLEEPRQQHARRVGQVRPRSALDLRQVRLAQPAAHFLLQRDHQVLLRHLAAQAAQSAFDQPQVTDFLAEFHITDCNYNIAICNVKNWIWFGITRFGKAGRVLGKRGGEKRKLSASD